MKTCSKCGRTSRKFSAQCWVEGNMCSVCWIKVGKRKYPRKDGKTCKKCGLYQDRPSGLCWRDEGMCGKCHYAELYPRKVSKYKLCEKCNNVMVVLSYYKHRGGYKTKLYKCTECNIIYDLGESALIVRHTQSVNPIGVLPNLECSPQR